MIDCGCLFRAAVRVSVCITLYPPPLVSLSHLLRRKNPSSSATPLWKDTGKKSTIRSEIPPCIDSIRFGLIWIDLIVVTECKTKRPGRPSPNDEVFFPSGALRISRYITSHNKPASAFALAGLPPRQTPENWKKQKGKERDMI